MPVAVFTDRLALIDPLITLWAATVLMMAVLAVRGDRRASALGGLAVALAIWTKLNGVLLLAIPLLGFLVGCRRPWRDRGLLVGLVLAPALVAYLAFRLHPLAGRVDERLPSFVLTFEDLETFPA